MFCRFWKYHGLGNDFVIVDVRDNEELGRLLSDAGEVRSICHRNFGVGADGILLVEHSQTADIRMIVYNSDGSKAEMCGNGLRCFARYVYDQQLIERKEFVVQTDRGNLSCELSLNRDHTVESIRTTMGPALIERAAIPVAGEGMHCIEEKLEIEGEVLQITAVSTGNPHVVLFDVPQAKLAKLGPLLTSHQLFPLGANVEFVDVMGKNALEVRVYERGCGWTQACGTGACASVVAAMLTGRVAMGSAVVVSLPGGILHVEVDPNLNEVWLNGPATPVFQGEFALPLR